MNKPLFVEKPPKEHLKQINELFGTPNQPGILSREESKTANESIFGKMSQEFKDMILWLLTYDSERRPSAATALKHPFFNELHFAKMQSQENKRSRVINKVISGVPLTGDETEQGGIRRTLEEAKEEVKDGDGKFLLHIHLLE